MNTYTTGRNEAALHDKGLHSARTLPKVWGSLDWYIESYGEAWVRGYLGYFGYSIKDVRTSKESNDAQPF